jgi:Uncharacterized conserved protein
MTIWGDLALDGARRTVTVRHTVAAAPQDVWDAFVDRGRAARWIGDLERTGSAFTLAMRGPSAAGRHAIVTGTVIECDPAERIVASWCYPGEPDTMLTVELAAVAAGTVITLTHSRMPAVLASEYGVGWEQLLDELRVQVGGGADPAPWQGSDAAHKQYRVREAALVRGEITRDGDASAVRLERLLDAQPDRVWHALTTPEGLGAWLWPVVEWPDDPARQRSLAVGDEFALGDPNQPEQRMRVLELDPGRSMTITWGAQGTSVRFGIAPSAEGTLFTLEQSPARDQFAAGRMRSGPDYAAGWHSLVDGLSLTLGGLDVSGHGGLWDAAYEVYTGS